MRHIRAAPPTPGASLRAVEARPARQTTQDRGPARRVRLFFTITNHAVPVRDRLHGVGEDREALVEVLGPSPSSKCPAARGTWLCGS